MNGVESSHNGVDPNAGLYCTFYLRSEQMGEASKEAGRPIFKDIEYIKVMAVGDTTTMIDRPVTGRDRQRFHAQYEAFLAGKGDEQEGTPLAEWGVIPRSTAEELKYFKLFTVEQLAAISDVHLQKFPGGHALKRKAIAFVEAAQGNAPFAKMEAELKERDDKIAQLEANMQALMDKLEKQGKK